jgi:hypothetical protein
MRECARASEQANLRERTEAGKGERKGVFCKRARSARIRSKPLTLKPGSRILSPGSRSLKTQDSSLKSRASRLGRSGLKIPSSSAFAQSLLRYFLSVRGLCSYLGAHSHAHSRILRWLEFSRVSSTHKGRKVRQGEVHAKEKRMKMCVNFLCILTRQVAMRDIGLQRGNEDKVPVVADDAKRSIKEVASPIAYQ